MRIKIVNVVLTLLALMAIACGAGGGSGSGGRGGSGACETTVWFPAGSPVDLALEPAPGAGTGGSGGPLGFTGTTSSYGGYTFSYWTYVPPSYSGASPTPVLYAYHGSGGNGAGAASAWIAQADAGGFIVAGLSSQVSSQWNTLDDGTTTEGMQLEIDANYNIDTTRRYVSGYSAGAHFTYLLALEAPSYYAAMAPIAGGNLAALPVSRKVPAVIVHGTNDSVVPLSAATSARDELYGTGHVVITRFCDRGHEWDTALDNPFIWSWIRHFTLANPP